MKNREEILEYVKRYGKKYVPAVRPADLPLMEMHKCFDNCVAAALKLKGKYKYVEGFAVDPTTGHYLAHAWLSDGIHAFDLTWAAFMQGEEMPVPTEYVGIELNIEAVVKFMRETTYCAVLINNWRAKDLAEEAMLGNRQEEIIIHNYAK